MTQNALIEAARICKGSTGRAPSSEALELWGNSFASADDAVFLQAVRLVCRREGFAPKEKALYETLRECGWRGDTKTEAREILTFDEWLEGARRVLEKCVDVYGPSFVERWQRDGWLDERGFLREDVARRYWDDERLRFPEQNPPTSPSTTIRRMAARECGYEVGTVEFPRETAEQVREARKAMRGVK